MKQTKKSARKKVLLKPLVWLTLLGMSAGAQAIPSPFAFIPLHLQSTSSSTSAGGVKPNVIIQFDDSGSMNWVTYADAEPGAPYWTSDDNKYSTSSQSIALNRGWTKTSTTRASDETRMTITKRALKNIMSDQTEKYTEKANIGIITLWDNGKTTRPYAEDVYARRRELGMTQDELIAQINNLKGKSATPALERYFDAAILLERAIKYRCQKSYVILFSDGDTNTMAPQPQISGRNATFQWQSGGTGHTERCTDPPHNKQCLDGSSWFAHQNPRAYPFPKDMTPYFRQPPYSGFHQHQYPPMFTYQQYNPLGAYQWNLGPLNSSQLYLGRWIKGGETWANHPDALPFAANMMMNDLKTANDRDGGVDAAGVSWDDDTDIGGQKPNQTQNIQTFTVGFGKGVSEAGLHSLSKTATGYNQQVLNAQSEEELNSAFKKIFSKINAENVIAPPISTSSISPTAMVDPSSTTGLLNGAASVFLDLANASSEIRFYKMSKSGKSVVYGVDNKTYTTPDYSERRVLFNRGGSDNRVFWLDNTTFAGSNEMFDIPNNGSNANEWRESLIPWLLRSKDDTTIANTANNAVKYRVRQTSPTNSRNIGDVLGSSLEALGENQYGRQRYLVTAANDGMLYFFESQNNETHPYKLKFNYMPAGMQRESATDTVMKYYKDIAAENYIKDPNHPHLFLLNGDIETRITANALPTRVFMSANMGQAGRGSYSLNLAGQSINGTKVGIDGNNWLSSIPLFETEKSAGNMMGYTIGKPGLGRLALNRSTQFAGSGKDATATMSTDTQAAYYATFVNSGVRNPVAQDNTESALYVYSTLGNENVGGDRNISIPHTTGQLLRKLVANPIGGGLAQPTLLDINLDGVVDVAYAGDYKGNLYRFDFRSGDPSTWTVHQMFKTKDGRPITSAPAVAYVDDNTFVVIFGTGSELYQSDLRNEDTQSVYGIYDFIGNPVPVQTTGVRELLKQTFISETGNNVYNTRNLSNAKIDLNSHKGWYFDLPEKSERVTVRPGLMLGTVLMTTRIYKVNTQNTGNSNAGDVCSPSSSTESTTASGWVMQFRSDTGGQLPTQDGTDENTDKFPFVDLTGELFADDKATAKDVFKNRGGDKVVSGIKLIGTGIPSMTALIGHDDNHAIGGRFNSTEMNGNVGDGGGSFEADLLTSNTNGKRENCYNTSTDSAPVLVADSSNSNSGLSETKTAVFKQCSGTSLRRISWREIF